MSRNQRKQKKRSAEKISESSSKKIKSCIKSSSGFQYPCFQEWKLVMKKEYTKFQESSMPGVSSIPNSEYITKFGNVPFPIIKEHYQAFIKKMQENEELLRNGVAGVAAAAAAMDVNTIGGAKYAEAMAFYDKLKQAHGNIAAVSEEGKCSLGGSKASAEPENRPIAEYMAMVDTNTNSSKEVNVMRVKPRRALNIEQDIGRASPVDQQESEITIIGMVPSASNLNAGPSGNARQLVAQDTNGTLSPLLSNLGTGLREEEEITIIGMVPSANNFNAGSSGNARQLVEQDTNGTLSPLLSNLGTGLREEKKNLMANTINFSAAQPTEGTSIRPRRGSISLLASLTPEVIAGISSYNQNAKRAKQSDTTDEVQYIRAVIPN